jgi:hypothetical protein
MKCGAFGSKKFRLSDLNRSYLASLRCSDAYYHPINLPGRHISALLLRSIGPIDTLQVMYEPRVYRLHRPAELCGNGPVVRDGDPQLGSMSVFSSTNPVDNLLLARIGMYWTSKANSMVL